MPEEIIIISTHTPDDWRLTKLGNEVNFQGGSQPPQETFISSPKQGYVRLLQIRDYKTDKYVTYIPLRLARKFCKVDDIMIGRYGPPVFQILKGLVGAYNVALMKAIPSAKLQPNYLYHFLRQDSLLSFVEGLSKRTAGQSGIDMKELKAYPLPLPTTKAEQNAIATALDDADGLITSLECIIAKKKAIKQGAMFELFKPKKGWELKKLGEISRIIMGQSPLSKYYNNKGIGLPLIQGNADVKNRKTIIRSYTEQVTKRGKIGDIIMSVRAPVGEISRASFDCCLGRGVCAISFENDYLYHYLIFLEKSWSQLSSGSTFDSVNSKQIHDFRITIPISKERQVHIAEILNEMDVEINKLESKLSKYRQIKTGMMQSLFTGKIRLV